MCSIIIVSVFRVRFRDVINFSTQRKLPDGEDGCSRSGMIQQLGWVIAFVSPTPTQCLKCGWTVMHGVLAVIFKPGRRTATSWANAAWTVN